MKNNIIFFDLETNGKKNCSVLSISAIKCLFDGKKLNEVEQPYVRYYFRKPGEIQNIEALKVHGLTDEIIYEKRNKANYELFFYKDHDNFRKFCSGVFHFVGHNINYDKNFLNFELKYIFCTMLENTDIIEIKNERGENKWPKLEEAALYYGLKPNLKNLHDSYYDTSLTYGIFKKMLTNDKTKVKVLKFLGKQ